MLSVPSPPPLDVFTAYHDGYGCFRIPVLARLQTGALAAFAEGRFIDCRDQGQRIDVVVKISQDNGATWGPLRLVYGESTNSSAIAIGNPTPVVMRDGRVLLLVTRNFHRVRVVTSTAADALNWSNATDVTAQVTNRSGTLASGPARGVMLGSGRLVLPAYGSAVGGAAALLSDDDGATWRASSGVPAGGESAVAIAPNGSLLLLSRRGGPPSAVQQAVSDSGGELWGPPRPLPAFDGHAPVRGSLLRVGSSSPWLLYSHPGNVSGRGGRWNLTVYGSRDSGASWAALAQVEPPSLNASELAKLHTAYSSLVQLNATHGAVLYERGPMGAHGGAGEYQRIRWHAFPLPSTEH